LGRKLIYFKSWLRKLIMSRAKSKLKHKVKTSVQKEMKTDERS